MPIECAVGHFSLQGFSTSLSNASVHTSDRGESRVSSFDLEVVFFLEEQMLYGWAAAAFFSGCPVIGVGQEGSGGLCCWKAFFPPQNSYPHRVLSYVLYWASFIPLFTCMTNSVFAFLLYFNLYTRLPSCMISALDLPSWNVKGLNHSNQSLFCTNKARQCFRCLLTWNSCQRFR